MATHIDDLALAADTEQELAHRLDELLQAFQDAGILVNAEKSSLLTQKIDWLGMTIINGQTISMLDKRKEVFNNQAVPTTRAELSKFIGCVNFCSPFIFRLSTYTGILTPLLSTTVKFEMAQIHVDAVNDILEQLRQAPHLYLVDKDHDIYVAIDSSYTGSGSVFYQLIDDRKHIIHFTLLSQTWRNKG